MVRSVLSNWVGLAVAGAASLIATPIFVHALGDFYYGMWALAAALLGYSGWLDMGMRITLQRYVARFKGQSDREASNRALSTALAITLGCGVCAFLLAAGLAAVLPGFLALSGPARSTFRWLMILFGLGVSIAFPARLLVSYLLGLGRFDLYNLDMTVCAVTRTVAQVGVLYLGHGILGIAAVALAAELGFMLLHWRLVVYADPGVAIDRRQVSWEGVRELLRFGFYAFLSNLGDYLRFYASAVLIARLLTVRLVTPFSIAGRLMAYFRQVAVGLTGPSMPEMSALEGQERHDELRELFLQTTRMAALFSLFVGSLVLLNGRDLLRVWLGESFVGAYVLLLILTVGYVAAMAQWPSNMLIYAKGCHRLLGWWTLGEGCANITLSALAAPKFGLNGVAAGSTVPMLFTAVLLLPRYAVRLLGISGRQYVAQALARPVAACVLFLGVCFLSGQTGESAGVGWLLFRLLWEAALFGGLAFLVGMVPAERRAALLLWRNTIARRG